MPKVKAKLSKVADRYPEVEVEILRHMLEQGAGEPHAITPESASYAVTCTLLNTPQAFSNLELLTKHGEVTRVRNRRNSADVCYHLTPEQARMADHRIHPKKYRDATFKALARTQPSLVDGRPAPRSAAWVAAETMYGLDLTAAACAKFLEQLADAGRVERHDIPGAASSPWYLPKVA